MKWRGEGLKPPCQSWKPPKARIPSTTLRYSRNKSLTSESRRSSSLHSKNRWTGGAIRTGTGECAPDDDPVSFPFPSTAGRGSFVMFGETDCVRESILANQD